MAIARVEFYRGRAAPAASVEPYFFYHIPKCGGTILHSAINSCWTEASRGVDGPPRLVARVDDVKGLTLLQGHPYTFLSSHLPFGVHQWLGSRPRLSTILREPVGRVRSAYTYAAMRAEQPVSEDEFAVFFRRPENRNVMTKTLAGLGALADADETALERAIANLQESFALYGTSRDIKRIFEAYLRTCGLPNVVSGRVNETQPGWQLDANGFADEIGALNGYDERLFRFVRDHKRLDPDGEATAPAPPPAHPQTVLLAEKEGVNASEVRHIAVPTDFLREIGLVRPDGTADAGVFTDFVASVRAQGFIA